MKEKHFIFKKKILVINSEDKVIIHDKVNDIYYEYIKEAYFIFTSLTGVYSVEKIVCDLEKFYEIPYNIASFFVLNILSSLLDNDLIEEYL